jgi:predicted DNA-binding ribbon-helix-helix protein
MRPRQSAAMKQALDAVGKSHDGLIFHNVRIGPLRTSLRLDAPTWSALREIAQREGLTLHQLCTSIKEAKPPALSLTVAIRCYALHYFCDVATADAHDRRKTTRC